MNQEEAKRLKKEAEEAEKAKKATHSGDSTYSVSFCETWSPLKLVSRMTPGRRNLLQADDRL